MVNSSIHKSSCPPPSSLQKCTRSLQDTCATLGITYWVAWRRARYSLSWGMEEARSCCYEAHQKRSSYILFFISFLSVTLLVAFSKVRFFPLMQSVGSVFCPSRLLVCLRRSHIPFFGHRANNMGSWRKCLLCASCYLAWHNKDCWSWTWERTSLRIFILKEILFHFTLSWNLSVGNLGKLASYSVFSCLFY